MVLKFIQPFTFLVATSAITNLAIMRVFWWMFALTCASVGSEVPSGRAMILKIY